MQSHNLLFLEGNWPKERGDDNCMGKIAN